MKEKETMQLPENAFRELKEGEEYKPLMSPDRQYPEVNAWSVTWGIIMAILFSAAAAYLGKRRRWFHGDVAPGGQWKFQRASATTH